MNVLQIIRAGIAASRLAQALIAEKGTKDGLTVAEAWSLSLTHLPEILAPFGVRIPMPNDVTLDITKIAMSKVEISTDVNA